MKKKDMCIIGIIAGVVIIILGFIVLSLKAGTTDLEYTSFGGDFYSYSYKASRIAAQNVGYLADIARKGIGFLLFAIGATDICLFGYELTNINNTPAIAPAMAAEEPVKEEVKASEDAKKEESENTPSEENTENVTEDAAAERTEA